MKACAVFVCTHYICCKQQCKSSRPPQYSFELERIDDVLDAPNGKLYTTNNFLCMYWVVACRFVQVHTRGGCLYFHARKPPKTGYLRYGVRGSVCEILFAGDKCRHLSCLACHKVVVYSDKNHWAPAGEDVAQIRAHHLAHYGDLKAGRQALCACWVVCSDWKASYSILLGVNLREPRVYCFEIYENMCRKLMP